MNFNDKIILKVIRNYEVRILDYSLKDLISKSQDGDISVFEELIKLYQKKIFNIAYRMVGNYDDASDIAQEVCIKIFRSIKKFKQDSSFSTWVYRITCNVCIDEIRKRKANTISLTAINEDKEYEIPIVDKRGLPDEIVENKETEEFIMQSINELSPEYRALIILRDVYGYTYIEISKILCINIGTVKSRLNRARSLLKEKIKKNELFNDKNV